MRKTRLTLAIASICTGLLMVECGNSSSSNPSNNKTDAGGIGGIGGSAGGVSGGAGGVSGGAGGVSGGTGGVSGGSGGMAGGATGGSAGSSGGDASADTGGTSGSGGTAGGSATDAGADADPACAQYAGTSADTACTSFASAFCNLYFNCMPARAPFATKALCLTREQLSCTNELAAPGVAVLPADIAVLASEVSAQSCADVYQGKLTQVFRNWQGCGGTAQLANSSGCFDSAQCQSGRCDVASGAACGTCQDEAASGASCQSGSDCQSGNCSNSKCAAPRATAGQSCTYSSDCADGLYCDSNSQCAALRQVGQSCTSTGDCDSGLRCGSSQVCEAPPLGDLGASCDPADPLGCNWVKGLLCDSSTNKCTQQKVTASAGEACGLISVDGGYSWLYCEPGASCVTPQGSSQDKCVVDAQDGAACDETTGPHCISPAVCAGGKCTVPSASACPTN
jgi:hypothetical protein